MRQADPRFSATRKASSAITCVRSLCPAQVQGRLTGVIYVDNRIHTGLFTESDRDLLAAFANQAAIAIENARPVPAGQTALEEVTRKDLLDNVFTSITSGVITTDVEDLITLCNRSAEPALGNTSANIVGQSLLSAFPDLDQLSTDMLQRVRSDQRAVVGHELK